MLGFNAYNIQKYNSVNKYNNYTNREDFWEEMNKQIPKKKRDNNEEKSPAFLRLQQMSTEGVSYGTKTQSHTFHSPIPIRYNMMSAKQLKTDRT